MNSLKKILLCISLHFPFFVFSQWAETVKKDTSENIIIYGDSFLFSIQKPAGWYGDVHSAKAVNANIIFYKLNDSSKNPNPMIQMLTYKKQDEQVDKDFEYEIFTVKEKHPKAKEQKLEVKNMKEYSCFAKIAYVENEFYHYIAYINPGSQFRNAFSLTMNVLKRPAMADELAAFKEIVYTLAVFKR